MLKINDMWKNFFDYVNEQDNHILKNLNPVKGKEIYVMKLCGNIMNNFINSFDDNDTVYIDSQNHFFFVLIPNTSKILITLFCCGLNLESIYSKFDNYGLAIEGCFNIEPITMVPFFYRGYEYDTKKFLTINNNNIIKKQGFMVVDNHHIIKIMDGLELESYVPNGINVQYIEGMLLYHHGEPFIKLEKMKDVIVDNKIIDGSNVTIDYNNFKINVNNKEYHFSDLGKNIDMVNNELFDVNNGLLVLAIDHNDNIFITYHRKIDFYNIMLFLKFFNCKDAILLCNSLEANIIWKEADNNIYNKTDFIGNPNKFVSNIIAFSG